SVNSFRTWFCRGCVTDLRALRFTTVGPPLAVAAASAALLVWFGKAWIPAQQRYFNERNLRTLRTLSTQIRAKVDGFAPALDHAIDSYKPNDGGEVLQRYVKLFSPELKIVSVEAPPPPSPMPGAPTLRIRPADGRNYIYLKYRHAGEHRKGLSQVLVTARADI